MQTEYVYIWKYIVKEKNVNEFTEIYSSEGKRIRLFHKSSDYIQTELLNDINNPTIFITIDYWGNK
jgi:hypothetical protein